MAILIKDKNNHKYQCTCSCGAIGFVAPGNYKKLKTGYRCRECANKKMCLVGDMINKKFGQLTVLRRMGTNGNNYLYECICDCGDISIYNGSSLRRNKAKRCKQCKRKLHLKYGTKVKGTSTWVIWTGILARCMNSNSRAYRNYGGRGITVCDRWKNFKNFYEDMGERPQGLQIDRINNDGNYEPGNCRWVTPKENCANRRKK